MIKRLMGRSWSSGELIVAVAVFVALFCNVGYFKSAANAVGTSGSNLMFLGSLFLQMVTLFILVLSAICHRYLIKPILIAFLVLSSGLTYFTTKYGTIFDFQMISNILETDSAEVGDVLSTQLGIYVLLLGLLPSLAIWRAKLVHPHWKTETVARIKLIATAAAIMLLSYLPFSANQASLGREHRDVTSKVIPTYAAYSTFKLASRSMKFREREHVIVGGDAKVRAGDPHRQLIVMVVGETVRADHWGLNGYARDTTPLLRGHGVINFPDFWSCDTSTAKSVPCMFSNLGRAKFDRNEAARRDNALDVLARAGVDVLWRDNNSSSKGVADRVTYQDFKGPDLNPICENGECRDEGMLHGLQEYIDAKKGDILIVLHQMGNHGPAYYKRYPKTFERFTPVCRTNDLGSCSEGEIKNAYDNAVLYTDYFLSKVIELLKQNEDRFETAMFYLSDHGESLGEYGMYLHATPYLIAPDAQKHIPAVIWMGSAVEHDINIGAIDARRQRPWSHDNVFSTLLGFFEIASNVYVPDMDLLQRAETKVSSP
ncbi:phosphoethanolamine--lipid A transferase [Hyphomicrobium sp.]|uniref:phosphoethanolamine transferase n=1 Tax=Hyphomicrobium sp. TaxID=82 RepID=UPI002E3421BA|nr:phosphoethanolamine--lipid A transferase [Hyphomicrobium sp.]HEX2842293.1 phosphoethanolamine--lipid A transferase [Hyphomicrobium sp.]